MYGVYDEVLYIFQHHTHYYATHIFFSLFLSRPKLDNIITGRVTVLTLTDVTVTVDTATSILTGIHWSAGVMSNTLLMALFSVSIPAMT